MAKNELRNLLVSKFVQIGKEYDDSFKFDPSSSSFRTDTMDEHLYFAIGETELTLVLIESNGEIFDEILVANLPLPTGTSDGLYYCEYCQEVNNTGKQFFSTIDEMIEAHLIDAKDWFKKWWNKGTIVFVKNQKCSAFLKESLPDNAGKESIAVRLLNSS